RSEIKLVARRHRPDEQGEQSVHLVARAGFPVLPRSQITPDHFSPYRAQLELLHATLVVELDVLLSDFRPHAALFTASGFVADADDHAVALLELLDPGVIDRLNEDHRTNPIRRPGKLSRGDEKRIGVAPCHTAE